MEEFSFSVLNTIKNVKASCSRSVGLPERETTKVHLDSEYELFEMVSQSDAFA